MRSKIVTVDSVRSGDVILLNDPKSLESMDTFYLECYNATSNGIEIATDVQTAQVLDVANLEHAYRIQIRTHDQRILDLEFLSCKTLSICDPIEVSVEDLRVNNEIILRGDNGPERLDKGYRYALIAARYGRVSKILKIHKTWRGTYRMIVLFGGVKPLKLIVDPGVLFEVSYSSDN